MCSFYNQKATGWEELFEISNPVGWEILSIVNLFMFYFVNWMFLLALLIMMFRIRYIKDNLSITTELQ